MIARNSEEFKMNTGQRTQVQQSRTGAARVDVNKYKESFDYGAADSENGAADRLLGIIAPAITKLGMEVFQKGTEEAYLEGVAKAGTGETEAALEGNPVTAGWRTAGYRDTMGRLKQADLESKVAADMGKMREQPPEKFAEYLAKQRQEILPHFEGMSLDVRKTMFAQRMMSERAAIKTHGGEHQKFIIDTQKKGVATSVRASIDALNTAKNDPIAYIGHTDNAFMTGYSAITKNPYFNDEIRGKLTKEFLEYAIASDNQTLYQKIRETTVEMYDGKPGKMSDLLALDDEEKLSGAYTASLKRTAAARNWDYVDGLAKTRADWENPDTPILGHKEFRAIVEEGIGNGVFDTPEKVQAITNEYYEKAAKKDSGAGLAAAYATGDVGYVFRKGKTEGQALDAFVKQSSRTKPMAQVVDELHVIGNTHGMGSAFKKIGEVMGPAVNQLSDMENLDPNNAGMIAATLNKIQAAEDSGRTGAMQQFLSAFDTQTQARIVMMREITRKSGDPVYAAKAANQALLDQAKLGPQWSANAEKENAQALETLTPRGIFGTAWAYTKALVGSTSAKDDLTLRAFESPFESTTRASMTMARGIKEVAEELKYVTMENPLVGAEGRLAMAKAEVAKRTVVTPDGPLVVPRGVDVHQFFGITDTKSTPVDQIGEAIHKYLKPDGDNRIAFDLTTNGQLTYQEFKSDGVTRVRRGVVDPKQVKGLVEQMNKEDADRFKVYRGEGATKVDPISKVPLQVNGLNSAHAEPEMMFKLREKLFDHEGVRDTPYKDLSGKLHPKTGEPIMTVGVGVSSHNPHYPKPGPDGKVTKEQIDESFRKASSDAAVGANKVMHSLGVKGEPYFLLFGELAYQSGTGFAKLKSYQPLMAAIRANDYDAASKALESTPAYKWTADGSKRRKHYVNTLKQAMKG